MNFTWVTSVEDELGVLALFYLECKYTTRRLVNCQIKPGEVAVFTINRALATGLIGTGGSGTHLRTSAVRLMSKELTPWWAWPTAFRVGIYDDALGNDGVKRSLRRSILTLAKQYSVWRPGVNGASCPWGDPPLKSRSRYNDFLVWYKQAISQIRSVC